MGMGSLLFSLGAGVEVLVVRCLDVIKHQSLDFRSSEVDISASCVNYSLGLLT